MQDVIPQERFTRAELRQLAQRICSHDDPAIHYESLNRAEALLALAKQYNHAAAEMTQRGRRLVIHLGGAR